MFWFDMPEAVRYGRDFGSTPVSRARASGPKGGNSIGTSEAQGLQRSRITEAMLHGGMLGLYRVCVQMSDEAYRRTSGSRSLSRGVPA